MWKDARCEGTFHAESQLFPGFEIILSSNDLPTSSIRLSANIRCIRPKWHCQASCSPGVKLFWKLHIEEILGEEKNKEGEGEKNQCNYQLQYSCIWLLALLTCSGQRYAVVNEVINTSSSELCSWRIQGLFCTITYHCQLYVGGILPLPKSSYMINIILPGNKAGSQNQTWVALQSSSSAQGIPVIHVFHPSQVVTPGKKS